MKKPLKTTKTSAMPKGKVAGKARPSDPAKMARAKRLEREKL